MRTRPGQSGAGDRRSGIAQSLSGLSLAVVVGGIAAFIAIPGCLNPRPEELPSSLETEPIAADSNAGAPVRETCGDNPYLAGCAAPDESAANPASSAPEPTPAPGASGYDIDSDSGTQADAGVVSDPAEPSSDAGP